MYISQNEIGMKAVPSIYIFSALSIELKKVFVNRLRKYGGYYGCMAENKKYS